MRHSPRAIPATLTVLALAASSVVALSAPAHAADPANATGNVVINEVSSNGFSYHGTANTDFIELYNKGASNVDLTGYVLSDDKGFSSADTNVLDGVLPSGGYAVIIPPKFGVGNGDHATLFTPSGVVVSTYEFTSHRNPSWARIPDGTGDFVVANGTGGNPVPTPGGPNSLTTAQAYISINEYFSDGVDFIELHNDSSDAVDVTGWTLADGEGTKVVGDEIILGGAAAVIPGRGYLSIPTQGTTADGITYVAGGFGLSKLDHIYLSTPAGVLADTTWVGLDSQQVSRHAAPSWARTTAGTGLWKMSSAATPGAQNSFPTPLTTLKINEVTNVGGHVELVNTGTTSIDISGVTFRNSANTVIHTVPAATTLVAGDFYYVGGLTGLTSADTLTVKDGSGTTVDSFAWQEDGIASYQRCEAFGVWALSELPTATFDAANACITPGGTPWPGSQDISIVDETTTFGDGDGNGEGDVSGASFDPNDSSILWTVQNKNTLFKLKKNAATGKYDDVAGWNGGKKLLFANGQGQPDSEGVTVGPDGALYITSERDNVNKSVSYNKVLRFDVSGNLSAAATLTATHEWDVNSQITTGSNLGLEGITWVPDSSLTAGGFTKTDGTAYSPSAYPGHGSGLFFVAVEATGALHALALPYSGATAGAPVIVKTVSSGFPFSMDVTWDADRSVLWALCDDSCGGAFNTLKLVDGQFTVTGSYARPTGMPNLNNEGLAIAPFSVSSGDYQEVVWTDDGDTDGHSLRGGQLWRTLDLTKPVPPVTTPPVTENPAPPVVETPVPTEFATAPAVALSSSKPRVGSKLQAKVTQPSPAADTIAYAWTIDGKRVSTGSQFTPAAKHAGEKVSLTVTFAKAGLTTVTKTVVSAPIVPKATVTKLKYKAVKVGKKQKATFSNLIPESKYDVYLKGKKIDTVKANANGNASSIFAVGSKKGTAKVTIKVGSVRTGKQFTIR